MGQYEGGDAFLTRIVTDDESRVDYHKSSTTKTKKNHTQLSTGYFMLTMIIPIKTTNLELMKNHLESEPMGEHQANILFCNIPRGHIKRVRLRQTSSV